MGLVQQYSRSLRRTTQLFPVWFPGDPVQLGDILVRKNKIFEPRSSLQDFGVTFETRQASSTSVSIESRSTVSTILQNGVEVSSDRLDASAEAELEISMRRANSFLLRTPEMNGEVIDNILDIGPAVRNIRNWRHEAWFIVSGLYTAEDFLFLGSTSRQSSVRFRGLGRFITRLLTAGLSANTERVSSRQMAFQSTGDSGAVAMSVVRVGTRGRIKEK